MQIAGADPVLLADAARYNVERGAQIIDINMGCPAKKVCNVAAGSALLSDEPRVAAILEAVVASVEVPVTLKIRTGPDPARRNAVRVVRIAEQAGIAALTVHGRTRACLFNGFAEYDTIAAVKQAVGIPVIANGDVDSPQRAQAVLAHTGADALMIGRAAQGRPWIFREIAHWLETGRELPPPTVEEARTLIVAHLAEHYAFYGEALGVRTARKHLGWYTRDLAGSSVARTAFNQAESASAQIDALHRLFDRLGDEGERLRYAGDDRNDRPAASPPFVSVPSTSWVGEALAA